MADPDNDDQDLLVSVMQDADAALARIRERLPLEAAPETRYRTQNNATNAIGFWWAMNPVKRLAGDAEHDGLIERYRAAIRQGAAIPVSLLAAVDRARIVTQDLSRWFQSHQPTSDPSRPPISEFPSALLEAFDDAVWGLHRAALEGLDPGTKNTQTGKQVDFSEDAAMLSATDLAKKHDLSLLVLIRKLNRWRAQNVQGWIEVPATVRSPHGPRFLYRSEAVKVIVKEIRKGHGQQRQSNVR